MRKTLICLILISGVLTSCSIVDSRKCEKIGSSNPETESTLKEDDKSKDESDFNDSDDNTIVNNELFEDNDNIITNLNEDSDKEDKYYMIIKKAWQLQKDYIDSIDDAKVKQSVQTAYSAAIMESTRLMNENPEDSELVNKSLKRVLDSE